MYVDETKNSCFDKKNKNFTFGIEYRLTNISFIKN